MLSCLSCLDCFAVPCWAELFRTSGDIAINHESHKANWTTATPGLCETEGKADTEVDGKGKEREVEGDCASLELAPSYTWCLTEIRLIIMSIAYPQLLDDSIRSPASDGFLNGTSLTPRRIVYPGSGQLDPEA